MALAQSLKKQDNKLSDAKYQMSVLNNLELEEITLPEFGDKIKEIDLFPLKPTGIEIFQMNMGKMCNQVCAHCHVDAGPDRKEIMSKEIMEYCLEIIANNDISTVDLTGGAPEMNPHFRWFVESCSKLNVKVLVRCNLTIILANPKYNDLPQFYKKHNVEVVSSMPHYTKGKTDRQRGDGVFDKSIKALQMLNKVGYGKEHSGLVLNLVYNPAGAFLPADQTTMENDFKKQLKNDFDIEFNNLFAITNIPISRYLDYLIKTNNYESYMEKLVNAYNPVAAANVMCRNTLSIGWDGFIYDCDFNQMLDVKVSAKASQHVKDYDNKTLSDRNILIGQHCFGCTAGAGSSCGGETS